MKDWKKRITKNPDQCGGRPCIRGMRIRVVDILDLLAAGLSHDQILEELPDLEKEDIEASIKYARGKIDPEIEHAWIDEVQKRKESLKSGEASLHSASDVINEARKRLQK